jgi:lincosamide nucleotidyltransferase A/C/D/E
MINAEDVVNLYHRLAVRGIQLWLLGGWGIDALLGEQTRSHKDLDVLMLLDDVVRTRALLHRDGYRLKELWSENRWAVDAQGHKVATAFVLHDAQGREFDAHAMRLDAQGNGLPAWEADGVSYTPPDLAGKGTIAGATVQCFTPEMQMRAHTGYTLPDKHWRDLVRLHETFGVAYPDALSRRPSAPQSQEELP